MVESKIAEVMGAIECKAAKVADGVGQVEMTPQSTDSASVQGLTNRDDSGKAGVAEAETWWEVSECS